MKAKEREELLQALKARFEKNTRRHVGITWADVRSRIEESPDARRSLREMEVTSGEPDVIGRHKTTSRFTFCDCSPESPAGRRSACYDGEALATRKENKPKTSAVEMAAAMGIELLTEEHYRGLQELGEFDRKRRAGSEHRPK